MSSAITIRKLGRGGRKALLLTSPGAQKAQLRAEGTVEGTHTGREVEPGVLLSLESRVHLGSLLICEFKTEGWEIKALEEGEKKKKPAAVQRSVFKFSKISKAKEPGGRRRRLALHLVLWRAKCLSETAIFEVDA